MPYPNAPDRLDAALRDPFNAMASLLNGGPSEPAVMTGIADATHYGLDVLNSTAGTGGARLRGASGAAVRVKDSTVEIDGALDVDALTATALTVTPGATSVTSLTASSTIQGTRLISTVAIGTPPMTVTSTTVVTNFNADMVDGQHGPFLNTTTGDARYLQLTGGTLTGQLVVSAAQALKLSGVSALGYVYLNATNIANPSLELKDTAGNTMVVVNPATSTYALDVNNGTPATNAARFTGDVLITTDLGVRTVNATTNVTAAKMVAGGTGFSGSEKWRVQSGTSRLEGQVVVTTGGVDVTGSSTFNTATQFASSIDVNGGALITNITVDGTGTPFTFSGTSQTSTTATAGAATLPANPLGFLKGTVGATDVKIPYYNA